MNIIVTGSLGNISKPLAQLLIKNGHSVTIISSNIERQKDIEVLNAKAAIGKLEDSNFLTQTFTGADAVYCMIPFDFKEQNPKNHFNKIVNSYVQAIKATEIKQVVFLSGWAADIAGSYNAGPILEQLADIAVAELRPGSFYTNFYGYIGMIKEQGVIMANYGGEDRIAFVSPSDIVIAVFEELTTKFQGRKIRYVASDELTCDEAARILGEAIGKPELKWITITEEQMLNGLLNSGVPEQLAKDLVNMQAATHSGTVYENYLRNRPVLGKTKLKEFAKEFAAVCYQQK
ncbi:MAG: NAD(P)H-binding protein [Flavipsychrobacter sp.]|nr:NAD(P)H-binding protein [Flavipsychrobacter sp.]